MSISKKKKAISLRLDQDLLEWFKTERPEGYQTLIQDVLKKYCKTKILDEERKAGRAQELFRQYYAQCFWHYTPDLIITPENINLVTTGLRKYGGIKGLQLAEDLCH